MFTDAIHSILLKKDNEFTQNFYNTIGVDFKTKTVQLDNLKCRMQIVF